MLFDNKHGEIDHNISIDGIKVNRVNVARFVGVLVDEHITWSDQINMVCRNVVTNLSILYKAKHILDKRSLYSPYCALILLFMLV